MISIKTNKYNLNILSYIFNIIKVRYYVPNVTFEIF